MVVYVNCYIVEMCSCCWASAFEGLVLHLHCIFCGGLKEASLMEAKGRLCDGLMCTY